MNCLIRGTANASLTLRGGLPAFGSGSGVGGAAFSVAFTGLSTDSLGMYGQIGNHAAIGFTINPPLGGETHRWSNSSNPADAATFGTGASPTTFASVDGFAVWLHVTQGAETRSRSFLARYAPGVAPTIAAQTFTVGVPITPIAGAASGAGLTFTYTATGLPAGVTIDASTGDVTGSPTTAATGTATVTPADQSGRTYPATFGWTAALRAQATAAGGLGPFTFTAGVAISATNLAADFTAGGNTLTFAMVAPLPSALAVSSAGSMTGTPAAETASTGYTVRATDEDGRQTNSTFSLAVQAAVASQLALLHSAGTEWDIHTTSEDLLGNLTFEVTIGGVTFGPFTRTAAQQVSGAAVSHIAPAIAETSPAGTYAAAVGLWTHGLDPEPVPTYQWTRNSAAISGATAASYATAGADNGTTLRCDVTVAGVTATSNGVAIGASAEITVAGATDGITFTSATTLTVTAGTDGITVSGA